MASVNTQMDYEPSAAGDGYVILPFSFDPNGTSNPTSVKGRGVASIVYTASNKWTVTLNGNFAGIIGAGHMISCAASDPAEGFTVELDTAGTDVSTGKVVLASVNAAGSRATINSATKQRIFVTLVLCTSLLDQGTVT